MLTCLGPHRAASSLTMLPADDSLHIDTSGQESAIANAYTLETPLEGVKLALDGRLQQVPYIQVNIVLLVVICDRLVGPFSFQV